MTLHASSKMLLIVLMIPWDGHGSQSRIRGCMLIRKVGSRHRLPSDSKLSGPLRTSIGWLARMAFNPAGIILSEPPGSRAADGPHPHTQDDIANRDLNDWIRPGYNALRIHSPCRLRSTPIDLRRFTLSLKTGWQADENSRHIDGHSVGPSLIRKSQTCWNHERVRYASRSEVCGRCKWD